MVRRIRRSLVAVLLAGFLLAGTTPATADEHDPERSGHPLRLIAYVAHPVGVIVDTLVFRPAHWLAHFEPFRTLFGHTD